MAGDIAHRLREAMGGQTREAVASSADIAVRTIGRILAGEETRRSTLVRLAHALGVSQDWLIDGKGPMRHLAVGSTTPEGHKVVQGPFMAFENAPDPIKEIEVRAPALFSTINIERMAVALKTADQAFASRGAIPTDRERIQAMTLIYDMLTQSADEAEQLESESEKSPANAPSSS